MRAQRTGFALSDVVGDDCLHPTHGVRGAEYVADILTHAFDSAASNFSSRHGKRLLPSVAATPLPAPMHAENEKIGDRASRCYGFVRAADYRKTYGQSSMYR